MFKKITIGLVVVIAAFLGFVALQPADFKISREIQIEAPADVIFAHVNDLQKFNSWNPFVEMDPKAKYSYEGPASGVGAASLWDGEESGKGKMTIVESSPAQFVRMRLDFEKPMAATNTAEFAFKSEGVQTLTSWSMTGHNNFVAKIFCTLLGGMDKMVGGQFEKGLAALKAAAETAAKQAKN